MERKKTSKAEKPRSVMKCVERGDVAGVRAAVAGGAGLMDEMEDTSPLALAVEKDDASMVEALLDLGHDPNLGGIVVPLALAGRGTNARILDLLLKRGANVDEPGEEGETALMWAAGAGNLKVVRRLLELGADLKHRDNEGCDALDYAVNGRHRETIDLLLPHYPKARQDRIKRQSHLVRDAGAERISPLAARLTEAINRPEPKKKPGADSLIRAFENGKHALLLKLLAAGADPNETNKEGTTILGMVASSSGIYDLLEPLLKAGADPNRGELFRPLSLAAAGHGAKFVRLLLDAGADVHWRDADGDTALMSAASFDDTEVIQMLLNAGADPNVENHKGHTAYWYALTYNNPKVIELLRPITRAAADDERPWRKNKEQKSLEIRLLDAAKGRDVEWVKRFLQEGAPVDAADQSGDTPLHHAAENDDLEMIETLLKAGAPLEAEGCANQTPLVTAASQGCLKAVGRLLKAGANVHATSDAILCFACENKDCLEIVELLLKAGANVNVIGGFRNCTPLHVATEHNLVEVARRLLQAGADVHTRDGNGWTPFLNAALRGSVEMIRLLIDSGSDVKAVDLEKRDPYDLASKWGKQETAAFLKSLLNR